MLEAQCSASSSSSMKRWSSDGKEPEHHAMHLGRALPHDARSPGMTDWWCDWVLSSNCYGYDMIISYYFYNLYFLSLVCTPILHPRTPILQKITSKKLGTGDSFGARNEDFFLPCPPPSSFPSLIFSLDGSFLVLHLSFFLATKKHHSRNV